MKLFRKRIKGNNKGLSLVELVCAVAIFGVAITAIGSAMVVSAQSYSRGTYELDVQEEAQTATNIVGNLIVDAVEATQVGNMVEIDGEGITYRVTYDSTARTLDYTEIDSVGNTANGVLAENVSAFSTNLTDDPADFKADRNVKVDISIEKNGRTYEASYNTTARNGSANAVGAAEAAQIIMDTTVVIEPGQNNLEIPVTVVGSVVNKTFSVVDPDTTDPISLSYGVNKVLISATTMAEGTYDFIVQTNEKDDAGIPLDTKTVTVQVRRIVSVGGTMSITSGDEGKNGSSYMFSFNYTGSYLDKVYGRDYDTNYVDPRQFKFEYSVSDGSAASNYIDFSTVVEQTGAVPSVSFSLLNDLPMGIKLNVTCTSKHSSGTNKTGSVYGPISKTLPIMRTPFASNGDIARGNDGNIKISVDSSYMQQLRDNNVGCSIRKIMEFYEASINAAGEYIKSSNTPVYTYLCTDGGNDTFIRSIDSTRMVPNRAYIMVIRLEVVDASNNVVWPDSGVEEGLYKREYPISPISITYRSYDGHAGTASDPYKMTTGTVYNNESICPWFDVIGLDMSKSWRDQLRWKVQKNVGGTWVDSSIAELGYQSGYVDGSGSLKMKCESDGHYRLLTWMESTYRNYNDDGNISQNFDFYDVNTGAGIVYIDFD